MTKQEIREIIETKNLVDAIYDAELCTSWGNLPEFDSLYAALSEWLTDAIDNGSLEFDGNWDPFYWGSDSVVCFSIFPLTVFGKGREDNQMWRDRLEIWKDEYEEEYVAFCSGMEKAAWKYIQEQENFEIFDAIMREGM